ncbi:uncharacterized protein LOC144432771 [Glandiceps talaboti]
MLNLQDVGDYSEDEVQSLTTSPEPKNELIFRLTDNMPEAVRMVLLERGWTEFEDDEHEEHEWNLWWKTSRFRTSDYDHIAPWQRVNHFPKATAITKKDCLARNMRRLQGVYGANIYNFSPKAFNLPNDYTKFVAEYTKMKQVECSDNFWICKPADLSRGRGIFIFRDLKDLQYDSPAVIQQYINNPLLISGYKFDLRIYVIVLCFHPLSIYIYKEGLVRFSTEKFDLTTLDNRFSHLTNTSINKLSPSYTTDKERVGPGCKWTLTNLRNYFHQQNIDDSLLWQRISNIVTLTTLPQAQSVPKSPNCFELFGYDILIDDNMKPWLLEVNFSPALGLDTQIDVNVKKPMLNDIIDMLDFKDSDAERGGQSYRPNVLRQVYSRSSCSSHPSIRKSSTHSSPHKKVSVSSLNRLPSINRSSMAQQPVKEDKQSHNTKTGESNSDPQGMEDTQKDDKQSEERRHPHKTQIKSAIQRMAASRRSSGSSGMKGQRAMRSTGCFVSGRNKFHSDSKVSINSDSGASIKSSTTTSSLSLPDIEKSRQQVEHRQEMIRSRGEQHVATSSSLSSSQNIPSSYSNSNKESMPQPKKSTSASSVVDGAVPHPPNRPQLRSRYQRMSTSTQATIARKTIAYQANPLSGKTKPENQSGSAQTGAKKKPNQRYKPVSTSHYNTHSTSRKPPIPKVGDFILTFPTNEAMRRACWPALDMRTVIREIQKQLRQSVIAVQNEKRNASRAVTISGREYSTMKEKRNEDIIRWEPMHPKANKMVSC